MAKRNTTGLPRKKRKQTKAEAADAETTSEGGILSGVVGGGGYVSREDREQRIQRVIFIGIGGVLGVLAVLIIAGILWESVIVPRQTVATVNGESISIAEFQDRVRLERLVSNQRLYNDIPFFLNIGLISDPNQILQQEPYGSLFQEITSQPELLGSRVLNDMIDEVLIRQQAAELGVSVDDAAVQEQVEEFFNLITVTEEPDVTEEATEEVDPTTTPTPFVSPTPSPVPTDTPMPTPTPLVTEEAATEEAAPGLEPTITPRPTETPSPTPSNEEREEVFESSLERFYTEARREADLNEDAVRTYFEFLVLMDALRETVTEDVNEMAPFVNARHILVENAEQAEQVLAALEAGESFADLARAVSTDTGSGSRGGELGWSAASNYVPPFRDATIEAAIGEVVGPVESEFGFHIIQVRAREDRELSEQELQRARDAEFNEWLESVTEDEANDIVRNDNWPGHVPVDPQFDPFRLVGDDTTDEGDDHTGGM
ncbi:MAG: peptidylprolyl isomerase [Chloroflexota bacterium]